MKTLLVAIGLSIIAGQAHAVSRYQTMRMDCGDVQAALRQDGAAILRWSSRNNRSIPIYGRYVSDGRYCELGEVSTFASVPTRDDRSCNVKKCIRPDNDHDRRMIIPH